MRSLKRKQVSHNNFLVFLWLKQKQKLHTILFYKTVHIYQNCTNFLYQNIKKSKERSCSRMIVHYGLRDLENIDRSFSLGHNVCFLTLLQFVGQRRTRNPSQFRELTIQLGRGNETFFRNLPQYVIKMGQKMGHSFHISFVTWTE